MKKIIAFNIFLLIVLGCLYYYIEHNKATVEIQPSPEPEVTVSIFKSANGKITFAYPREFGNSVSQENPSKCLANTTTENVYFKGKASLLITLYPCNYTIGDLNQLYIETYKSKTNDEIQLASYTVKSDPTKYVLLVQSADKFFIQLDTIKSQQEQDKKLLIDLIASLRIEE
jgi:hypothetical protein